MTTATLVRRHLGVKTRARETYTEHQEPEVLFEGELAGAIEAAKAIPTADRLEVTLETEQALYGPEDFDYLTPDELIARDVDLAHGSSTIRIEAAAFALLRGDRKLATPMAVVGEHLDLLNPIVVRKSAAGEVEEADGKRLIRVTAADIEQAR